MLKLSSKKLFQNRKIYSGFNGYPCLKYPYFLQKSGFHGNPGSVSENSLKDVKISSVLKELTKNLWPKDNKDLKRRVVGSIILLIGAKISNVSVPFMMKFTVDKLTENTQLSELSMEQLLATGPGICILTYGVLRLTSVGFNELKNAIFSKVTQENVRSTSINAFNHIQSLDLNFHLSRRTGMISKVLDRGSRSISFILGTLLFNWIPTMVEIILVCSIMFFKCGPLFALTSLACICSYVLFTFLMTRWRIKYRVAMNAADNEAGSRMIDSLINYETVKYFNNEKHELNELNKVLLNYEKASLKTSSSLALLNFGQNAIFSFSLVAIMMLATKNIYSGNMTIGDLTMVNGLLFQLSVPLYFLGSLYRDIREAVTNLSNLYAILDEKKSIKIIPGSKPLALQPIINPDEFIRFDNVSFGYNSENHVLKGVNIKVGLGKKVAIVGGSGSGKSTLSRLLYRFYDPLDGQILINGQPINLITLESLRQSIAVIPQDQVLFHNSIFYNIHYGNFKATESQVYEAAKVSGLDKVIDNFPQKYHAQVGERGLKLSGGEKQRVAIARAILKNSPIFVYDEATSSLDSILEKKILLALNEALVNRTSIVIAHRLSTIIDSDCIYVLKDGVVNESGKHLELLKNPNGTYSELWRKQNDTIYKKKVVESQLEKDWLDNSNSCGMSDNCCKS